MGPNAGNELAPRLAQGILIQAQQRQNALEPMGDDL